MNSIVFIDTEVNPQTEALLDLGAVKPDNSKFHSASQNDFAEFISGSDFICGHNIFAHDLKYIGHLITDINSISVIDTLCLSPLLFPNKPYHALLKDDKLQSDELNNPLNDSVKAMELFFDEINAFEQLKPSIKEIYYSLLKSQIQFSCFFKYISFTAEIDVLNVIRNEFSGKVCGCTELADIIKNRPIELAYCLAVISANDRYSITPSWVLKTFPTVQNVIKFLRNTPCREKCEYCKRVFDVKLKLESIFGFENFRIYNGEPLQEMAANAAVNNRSLLAIFPTGGGKSITFQLPALIAGEAEKGLTVVISPLQSLMKDQVDNLSAKGNIDAVTINGLLDPIERAEACARVESGMASLLYISPESLRSKTIEKLLLSRNVVRFVIDEAHCFSSWGQDFRVDYLFIGDFIAELQNKKNLSHSIPISCFTATAKQKVVSDIRDYFMKKLGITLDLYATSAARNNLRYEVLYMESDEKKHTTLRDLITQRNCPTIVYVSRTNRTVEIAKKLNESGISARPFNGKMDSGEKIANQDAFIKGEVQVIVATSAFGMGVDKKDVKLVVHFDISDSLENYVQEAGRAGRDENIDAECYVLFNDTDLDKHFILLNQTKLSISEIGQVWRAIKELTGARKTIRRSPLEIARQAGWDDSGKEIETRVKTAISALEIAGYIKRGMNSPKVYATGILAKNMEEASNIITNSHRFNEQQKRNALRLIKSLISSRSIAKAGNDDAESRVDYLSDRLGISKENVIESINLMREEGLLSDSKDLTAYIRRDDNRNKSLAVLRKYIQLESFLISVIEKGEQTVNLKEINEQAETAQIKGVSIPSIRTIFYYWTIKGYIKKALTFAKNNVDIIPEIDLSLFKSKFENRRQLTQFIVEYLYEKTLEMPCDKKGGVLTQFSELELKNAYADRISLSDNTSETTIADIEDALLYLSKIDSLSIEGNFLVLYNAMEILRLEIDNKTQFKKKDYEKFDEFYKQKIQQIHIVGEYANMMVRNYSEALSFVNDYFQMDYKKFITKYFKGERLAQIERNITPQKYEQVFGCLSDIQSEIINDNSSRFAVVAAGPGSGKTRVLVHKLASLLIMEDVKHEQLLMLTFSRAAATEFKKRLIELIGNAANYVEIKTFHSYCYDLLGRIGNMETMSNIVKCAVDVIARGEAEVGRITKTVVVIDEAQDMDESEFALIEALINTNEGIRVIAVGDDDQNIFEFRGSSAKYLKSFITDRSAVKYEMTENYRSNSAIVDFANAFVKTISHRLKNELIKPVTANGGGVRIIKHKSKNLEIPLVNNIKYSNSCSGICVLTSTNDEALRVVGLLIKNGFNAKLIQDNKSFSLYNLVELRHFIKYINSASKSPIISDEVWNEAKNRLQHTYAQSSNLRFCLNLLAEFEQTNNKKYRTDFEIFVRESHFEDFFDYEQETIIVSTIHKSKGREFDSVYMLLNNFDYRTDAAKRLIYVGITRAKSELFIHCNNNCFDKIDSVGIEKISDDNLYEMPAEIIMQLSHEDVKLGCFMSKKDVILNLRSGCDLVLKGEFLFAETESGLTQVLAFSDKFCKKIIEQKRKGYTPFTAKIRFILAWKDKNKPIDSEESAIILPDVYFRKDGLPAHSNN